MIKQNKGNIHHIHPDSAQSDAQTKPTNRKSQVSLLLGLCLTLAAGSAMGSPLDRAEGTDGWLDQVFQEIKKSEYDIRWIENAGVHMSANRAQNLRFTYYEDGFAVEPRVHGEVQQKKLPPPWQISIRLDGYGKGATSSRVSNGRWSSAKNSANIDADGIQIEYLNDEDGMRQNFRVLEEQAGSEPLTLTFSVDSGPLDLNLNEQEDYIYFTSREAPDQEVVGYSDLHVFDASGRELAANMVVLNRQSFAIVVDDQDAAYPILIDPLTSVQAWTQSGGMKFGFSVSDETDIASFTNTGGVIVGAPYFDDGANADVGKVFFYYGNSGSLPTSPQETKTGDSVAGARFGYAIARVGVVSSSSGDCYLISAPYQDSGGYTDNGKVFLYRGGGSSLVGPIWTRTSSQNNMLYGWSVGGGFDANGDGTKDFLIGAPYTDYAGLTDCGLAEVYHGNPSGNPDTVADWYVFGASSSDLFGWSVANAGNPKGVAGNCAIVIGAIGYSSNKGRVYAYYSSGTGLGYTPTTIDGAAAGNKFGFSVAGVGDSDGNGKDDVLVGAPYHTNGQTAEGKAYLYRGTASGVPTTADWTVEGDQANANLGYAVAGNSLGKGDLNGDTKADFVIGLPYYDTTSLSRTDNGEAWFYLGGSTPTLHAKVIGGANGDHNGWSVAIGNVLFSSPSAINGLIVGAPDASSSGGTVSVWKHTP